MFNIFLSPGHNEHTWKNGSKMINAPEGIFKEFNDFNIKVIDGLNLLLKNHSIFKIHQLEFNNDKVDMELFERIQYINKFCTMQDIIISVHANYNNNFNVSGVDLFYSGEKSKKLTELYIKYSKDNIIPYRKTWECTTKEYWLNLGIVLKTKCPVILVEAGFFSNAFDRKNLKNEIYQNQVIMSCYKMICEYYNIKTIIKDNMIEDWKIKEVEKAIKNGFIDNDDWKNKINELIPVWAVLEMINDCYEKYDKKIEILSNRIKVLEELVSANQFDNKK